MPKLLVFVNIFVDSPMMDEVLDQLNHLPGVEQLYEVTGEFDVVALISAENIDEFRHMLKDMILKMKGVKSTVTSVVLHSHKGSHMKAD
jgi:DNA-binding Lrp family transcriptional regulator